MQMRGGTFTRVSSAAYFVENFLQELSQGEPPPPTHYDESRHLNVTADGRALVDIELDGGTVTGTKAGGEQDDADRDPEPTTVTMVQSEGYDYAAEYPAPQAGTITVTEATAEASDADEELSQLLGGSPDFPAPNGTGAVGLLGTITNTAVELENSDVD